MGSGTGEKGSEGGGGEEKVRLYAVFVWIWIGYFCMQCFGCLEGGRKVLTIKDAMECRVVADW